MDCLEISAIQYAKSRKIDIQQYDPLYFVVTRPSDEFSNMRQLLINEASRKNCEVIVEYTEKSIRGSNKSRNSKDAAGFNTIYSRDQRQSSGIGLRRKE